jgi:hypothetical protein
MGMRSSELVVARYYFLDVLCPDCHQGKRVNLCTGTSGIEPAYMPDAQDLIA